MGSTVNVLPSGGSGGPEKRGTVTKLSAQGPTVQYTDKTQEVIPVKDVTKRVAPAPQAVGRITGPDNAAKVKNAEIMFGTNSPQHKKAQQLYGGKPAPVARTVPPPPDTTTTSPENLQLITNARLMYGLASPKYAAALKKYGGKGGSPLPAPAVLDPPADQGSIPRRAVQPRPVPTSAPVSGDTRTIPAADLGMEYSPANAQRADVAWARSGAVDWSTVPTVDYPMGNKLHATEDAMTARHIEKIQRGEPLRAGYDPQILRTDDGDFVVDGHHRVGMYAALGRDTMPTKVLDIRGGNGGPDVKDVHVADQPQLPDGPVQRDANGAIVIPPESMALGTAVHQKAVSVEPEISSRLAALIGEPAPGAYQPPVEGGHGTLYGFKYRLKDEAGIQLKIERIREEKILTREDAAKDIKDAVRYTVHFPEGSFGPSVQGVINKLQAENAGVVVKNTWPPEKNSAYKGINVSVTRHDGVTYEVQFHTVHSQSVKDRMHVLYDTLKDHPVGSPKWQAVQDEMTKMSATMPLPAGAADVVTPTPPGR